MTDTEKAALEARIDELCAENEKLRQLADGAANEADRLTHDAAAFQIENAKLRELVRDMWREGAFEPGANYVTEAYGLEERTRELGIEVR